MGAQTIAAIIPLYNGAAFIEQTLESVFSQTRVPDEIVVVDDRSTDNGAEVAFRAAGGHATILRCEVNGGQSSARNKGVAYSKANLIALLDQDDIWYPTHLAELSELFTASSSLGWAYSNIDYIDVAGNMIRRSALTTHGSTHPKRLASHCAGEDMHILPSSSLIKRDAFDAVGGFDTRLSGYEDDDLFYRLFRAGYDNAYLEKPLSAWRIHPASSGHSPRMLDSRSVYAEKLLVSHIAGTPTERQIAQRIIIPRFTNNLLIDIRNAARSHDNSALGRALDRYAFLQPHLPRWHRWMFAAATPLLRNWRSALAIRPILKTLRQRKRVPL
jgi:glycosyltransferase involved in cell wall biosynthesis